ncbi:hypothetical protein Mapa_004619 [Marchantia paleacea]|nr:hypothetical protein Mapa_004619 [Marchantia paleacea]
MAGMNGVLSRGPTVAGVRVKPNKVSLVKPMTPTEDHWLNLSNLDRVVNPTFSSIIHFFENPEADMTENMRNSLSKVLVDFYPLAGRLEVRVDGVVDLHCNDGGAIFIEATVDVTLAGAGGAQPMWSISGMDIAKIGPGPLYVPDQEQPMPVLVVMVTEFKCGAIAVATNWHHTVADGFSGTHFMKSWAEVAQGLEITIRPDHNRAQLKPRNPLNPTLVNGYTAKPLMDLPSPTAKRAVRQPALLNAFHLAREAASELKTRANLQPPPFTPGRSFTTAESISAHLWIQMTKARMANADSPRPADSPKTLESDHYRLEHPVGHATTRFFIFVDGRKKLGLKPGYFGNVVCSACAMATEEEIAHGSIHLAASHIRTATRNITGEYFRSLIDWVEEQGVCGLAAAKSEHVNSMGHDVAATFWTFFPLYDIKFAGENKPVFAARNSPPRPLIDGIAIMPGTDGPGSMVALLNLHSDRMSKLQRQLSFMTVFH